MGTGGIIRLAGTSFQMMNSFKTLDSRKEKNLLDSSNSESGSTPKSLAAFWLGGGDKVSTSWVRLSIWGGNYLFDEATLHHFSLSAETIK
ncbi:hypothetical protein [Fredinandcohnia sp. 179-A 10B2 NHS]|uniref:hypothetical protein n=1 Tax=Fredinandcohnia sp. 179-A 10B2 NHS TaxID=3235176 RepID=UPI0039A164D8